MLRVLLFAALALVLCPANSSAELVGNVIDDFSSATTASATGISRTAINSTYIPSEGFLFIGATPSFSNLIYTADSGTFGDLDDDFVNGVSFSTSAALFGPFSIKVFGGNGGFDNQIGSFQVLTGGPVTFDSDFSSFDSLRFEVQGNGPGAASLTGTLTVVPEPTSFALFGVVVAGIGYRRRRR